MSHYVCNKRVTILHSRHAHKEFEAVTQPCTRSCRDDGAVSEYCCQIQYVLSHAAVTHCGGTAAQKVNRESEKERALRKKGH